MYQRVLIDAFYDEMQKLSASAALRIPTPTIPKVGKIGKMSALKAQTTQLPSHNFIPQPPPQPMMSTIQPMVVNAG